MNDTIRSILYTLLGIVLGWLLVILLSLLSPERKVDHTPPHTIDEMSGYDPFD